MTKTDRIALVISVPYLLMLLAMFPVANDGTVVLIIGTPLFVYWGYRFIKNDISFLKKKPVE